VNRTALDEVVQMMGGLAYMTGRPGDPLRAGTSVNDIMGGLFGAIGTLGALIQRGITGRGMEVQTALFENNVFLVGQHMLQFAVTGRHPAPMPARDSPWAIYDVFTVSDGEQIFLAAVSDAQWLVFCDTLGFADLKADPALATNNQRVQLRPTLLATLRERLATRSAGELATLFESAGLPFAPIRRPEDLYDDPHLIATGGLADIRLPDGAKAGQTVKHHAVDNDEGRRPRRADRPAGERRAHARAGSIGYAPNEIDALLQTRRLNIRRKEFGNAFPGGRDLYGEPSNTCLPVGGKTFAYFKPVNPNDGASAQELRLTGLSS
jgi:crotonobetainyl-CoA:carnitine CoA-transferase CaiB-like acyl-CoA transferase